MYNITFIHSDEKRELTLVENITEQHAIELVLWYLSGDNHPVIHFSNTYGKRYETFAISYHINPM